jgi:hypothetical protein
MDYTIMLKQPKYNEIIHLEEGVNRVGFKYYDLKVMSDFEGRYKEQDVLNVLQSFLQKISETHNGDYHAIKYKYIPIKDPKGTGKMLIEYQHKHFDAVFTMRDSSAKMTHALQNFLAYIRKQQKKA